MAQLSSDGPLPRSILGWWMGGLSGNMVAVGPPFWGACEGLSLGPGTRARLLSKTHPTKRGEVTHTCSHPIW